LHKVLLVAIDLPIALKMWTTIPVFFVRMDIAYHNNIDDTWKALTSASKGKR